jgi:hypothetical protein
MAKKSSKPRSLRNVETTPAANAPSDQVPVIVVPPGGTLEVVVDVGPMVIPYAVAYAQHTVIKSLVDRAEMIPVQTGDFVLAWSFEHAAKGWSHSIGFSVNGGAPQLLEKKSEAKKDSDVSVGFAIVRG